ncbi:unnamed protein product [Calypogeia fissa]
MRADEECGRSSDDDGLRPTDEEEEEEEEDGGDEASSSSSFFLFPCRRAAVENCARFRLRAGFSVVRIGNRHWFVVQDVVVEARCWPGGGCVWHRCHHGGAEAGFCRRRRF